MSWIHRRLTGKSQDLCIRALSMYSVYSVSIGVPFVGCQICNPPRYPNGSTYTGEWLGPYRHGHGLQAL